METITYTGIGSRKTPPNVQYQMSWLGYQFARKGRTFRSGGAEGADLAFENGARHYYNKNNIDSHNLLQIFFPGNYFNQRRADARQGRIDSSLLPGWSEAHYIASQIHPKWSAMDRDPWMQDLHARNVFQVLGPFIDHPSDYLVYYAPEDSKGNIKGGTRTAVVLARQYQIPTYNLLWDDTIHQLVDDWGF